MPNESNDMKKQSCLKPSAALLVKLGSIAVHVEEMLSPSGHAFDLSVLQIAFKDPEIVEWIEEMNKLALLPVKR